MRSNVLLLPLLVALGAPLALGCVSSGRYDEAVKSANANAQSAIAWNERAQVLEKKLAEATRNLDETTAMNAQLRTELQRLGHDADQLLAERGTLATALDQSRSRLEELRRAEAAAELRAIFFRELALKLKSMVDAGQLSIQLRDGRMVLALPNDVLFDSGQTDLKPKGATALKQIAAVLKTIPHRHFQVAGHTDNVPIETTRFASNWELSNGRALEVVRFLVQNGVSPSALSAAGYGEFDPVAPNEAAIGRAKNRRIEITVVPNIEELVQVPR